MTVAFQNKSQCSDFAVSNATKTTLATTVVNDMVVVGLATEQNPGITTFGTPTGHSLTYTLGVTRGATSRGNGSIYTSSLETAGASGWSVSDTVTGTLTNWGLGAVVFSGTGGVGASSSADFNTAGTLAQLALTTTAANSAIVWLLVDWQAADHSTRVYQTVNGFTPAVGGTGEVYGIRVIGQYSAYMAYWPDVGAAGAKTVGTTTEAWNGGFSMMALEIKAGAAGPPKVAARPRAQYLTAVQRAANW